MLHLAAAVGAARSAQDGGGAAWDRVARGTAAVRAATAGPVGVNVFLPGPEPDPAAVAAYARRLAPEADRRGVPLGEPAGDGHRDAGSDE